MIPICPILDPALMLSTYVVRLTIDFVYIYINNNNIDYLLLLMILRLLAVDAIVLRFVPTDV